MHKEKVNLEKLRRYSEQALNLFFRVVDPYWEKEHKVRLRDSKKDIQAIFNEGLKVMFRGDAPYEARTLNYGIFLHKIVVKHLPVQLWLKCIVSTEAHKGIIRRGGARNCIVAGILANGRFSSYSPSWTIMARPGSPQYDFGCFINDVFLDEFHLK